MEKKEKLSIRIRSNSSSDRVPSPPTPVERNNTYSKKYSQFYDRQSRRARRAINYKIIEKKRESMKSPQYSATDASSFDKRVSYGDGEIPSDPEHQTKN